jgi:anhydro-N-acetylmuramic acid kinase
MDGRNGPIGRLMSHICAIGLMSGTSYDGVDVALVETDGERISRLGPSGYRPYSGQERDLLRRAMVAAAHLTDRTERPKIIAEAEELVTDMHAEAVEAFLAANAMAPDAVGVVGFHGQTVLHRPERGLTVQLGNGAVLAARLGIPVVHDFRAADVAAGGQGAPLVPVFHRALVRMLELPRPLAVLNIGGVANVTLIDRDDELVAFDTGPGNALIDDFLQSRSGQIHDDGGRTAAAGRVDEVALARLLAHPFFSRPPPKSLDRNDFRHWVMEEGRLSERSTEDGAATITALTAAAIARAITVLPRAPLGWIVAGGGTRNPTLMRMLAERLRPAEVRTAQDVGWSADALEAQAFAYLAVRTLQGLPITFPTTTGAPRPMSGGVVAR